MHFVWKDEARATIGKEGDKKRGGIYAREKIDAKGDASCTKEKGDASDATQKRNNKRDEATESGQSGKSVTDSKVD